jgi:hypothetical protein
MKCNETLSKWYKNKHGASKIIDTFEMYQHALLIFYEMALYKLGLLVRPLFLGRNYVITIVVQ